MDFARGTRTPRTHARSRSRRAGTGPESTALAGAAPAGGVRNGPDLFFSKLRGLRVQHFSERSAQRPRPELHAAANRNPLRYSLPRGRRVDDTQLAPFGQSPGTARS